MIKVCMIVPESVVKGGIAAVVNGYRGSWLEKEFDITYIESYRDGSKWQKLWKACVAYVLFWKNLRRNRPDVVHVHSSFGPSFYRKLPFIVWSRRKGIPVVNHIHGAEFEAFYDRASVRKKELIGKIYNKCTKVIVLSEEWRVRICRIVPADKIEIVENYCQIPGADYRDGRKKNGILFLGELGRRKGCYDIPEIIRMTAEKFPEVRLVMAGDGELREIKQAFADKGVADKVIFPGWVRGVGKEKLLRESSVFLFPSYHEGMPMAVLEAMGYGLGIVTTCVGGIPKLLVDGADGFVRKPGDTEALAQAVITLLENPDLCRQMGERARETAVHQYGLDGHLEKIKRIYEGIVGEAKD